MKGNAEVKSSGALAAITKEAEKILPDTDSPVISLETSSTYVYVRLIKCCRFLNIRSLISAIYVHVCSYHHPISCCLDQTALRSTE